MKNDKTKNLRPLSERTPEERRAIARKGAEAANAKRRENKRLSQLIDAFFERTTVFEGEELTLKEKAVLKACKRAASGDLDALALLAKLNGESKEQIQIESLPDVKMNVFGFND